MEPLEERVVRLEEELHSIRTRNARVEDDKAWETSSFRIAVIVGITYVVAFSALTVMQNQNPLRNALIPAVGYFLSVQSIPFLKRFWLGWLRKR